MPKFGKSSKARLATCHPDLQRLFNEVIKHVDCSILCGQRDKESQDAAFDKGTSKLRYPYSKHNGAPSLAVDVGPYYSDGTKVRWNDSKGFLHFSGFVRGVASQMGIDIRVGADWDSDFDLLDQTFNDLPHFELIK